MQELRMRNASQSLFVTALSSAYRGGHQLHDPSVWSFRDPEVEEKMLRDADIAHAVTIRKHMIAGRDWTIQPRRDASPTAELEVMIATELLSYLRHFTQGRLNLARAFFSGARMARIILEPRVLDIGDGQLRTWVVPIELKDQDKRVFRRVPTKGADDKIRVTWERWHIGKDKWLPLTPYEELTTIRHTYADSQENLGHGNSLKEAIGWWWYAKEHVFQESLAAVERFAQGIIHAKVDGLKNANSGKPNSTLIQQWVNVLEDMRARHVLVSDKEDDVSMIPLDGTGWQMLTDIRADLRRTIFTLVLGSELVTSQGEGTGSYALGNVHENSTEALIQYDRETLEETLTDDLMGALWQMNRVNLSELGVSTQKDMQPRFAIKQEKRHDPMQRAQVLALAVQNGMQIATEDAHEQLGFREPEAGEAVIVPPAPEPAADPFGGGGFGGGMFKRKDV